MTIPLLLANILVRGPGALLAVLATGFVAGVLVGVVGAWRGAGRFGFSMAGLAGYAMLQVPGMRSLSLLPILCAFMGAYMAAHLFALYGMRREYRTLEGTD